MPSPPQPRRTWCRATLALVAIAGMAGSCGSTPDGTFTAPNAPVITLAGFSASPARVQVQPGGAVIVLDQDRVQHELCSAAASDADVPGAVNGVSFATPPFSGRWTLAIPRSAPPGTVVPWFCALHPGAPLERGEIEIIAGPP